MTERTDGSDWLDYAVTPEEKLQRAKHLAAIVPPLPEPIKELCVSGDHDAVMRFPMEDVYDAEQMREFYRLGYLAGSTLQAARQVMREDESVLRALSADRGEACPRCSGSGVVERSPDYDDGGQVTRPCRPCDGTGKVAAPSGVSDAMRDALRKLVTEALTKVENDRTLWVPEWQEWTADAHAALEAAQPQPGRVEGIPHRVITTSTSMSGTTIVGLECELSGRAGRVFNVGQTVLVAPTASSQEPHYPAPLFSYRHFKAKAETLEAAFAAIDPTDAIGALVSHCNGGPTVTSEIVQEAARVRARIKGNSI